MRKPRLIGRPGSVYHVISRFVDKKFALGSEREKQVFQNMMFRQAAFAGVEILTFCLMSNHFHLLVRVPERPGKLPEHEVLRRASIIWSKKKIKFLREKLERHREDPTFIETELERFRVRMFDLSQFVKDVKQRYAQWYNRSNDRVGTLHQDCFKSVLVQSGRALRFMAAYIDLNPVRAGMVHDPVDYPYCGYAQAVAGNQDRRRGLRKVMTDPRIKHLRAWRDVARAYRLWLFERGRRQSAPDRTIKKRGFTRAEAIEAWTSEGVVPPAKLLRCKCRYLTDSLIFGTREFLEEQIDALTDEIKLKHPKARPNASGLCGLVNLRGDRTS